MELTLLAAAAVRRVRHHAQGGAAVAFVVRQFSNSPTARARCAAALAQLIREVAPELEVDGEMHPDTALVPSMRERILPDSCLEGVANLLVMPSLDAANIAFNLVKAGADGLPIGPILLGMSKPIHVVVPTVTARGIINVSMVAAQEAQLLGKVR